MRIGLSLIALAAMASAAFVFTSADVRYRVAEHCYQKGDFEKAAILCEKALQPNPRHAPSRALYTEIQFILGKGKATESHACDYSRCMSGSFITTSPPRRH
jgi:hypothetical protein